MYLEKNSSIILSIERACNDLRKGFPVIIEDNCGRSLVLSPETASADMVSKASKINDGLKLIITANRYRFLSGNDANAEAYFTVVSADNIKDIANLCGVDSDKVNAVIPKFIEADNLEAKSLQLARIAELIPSVLSVKLPETFVSDEFLSVTADNLDEYNNLISYELVEACRTNIVLKNSIESQIIAYRPKIGGKEHYAIVIGKPSSVPLVRVHSSCYTGDLLESLACDCHDQLHLAVDVMNEEGGGIILYLLQEGRGIGLINKLRAYALKEKGFDTVDANEALGFDDDERLFAPAGEILKKMNINKVRLLSNNPKKAIGLEKCGVKVAECVPHIIAHNVHNEHYLQTKSTRLGHTGLHNQDLKGK